MEKRIALTIRGANACVATIRGVRRYVQTHGITDWVIRAAEAERGSSREGRESILAWKPHGIIVNSRYDGTLEKLRAGMTGPIISTHRPDFDTPTVCVDHRAVGGAACPAFAG